MKTTIINCDCCGKKVPEMEAVEVEQYVRFTSGYGGEKQVYGKYYKTASVCDPEISELCPECYNKLLKELEPIKRVSNAYRNAHN